MCGRFEQSPDARKIQNLAGAVPQEQGCLLCSGEIRPTNVVPVLVYERGAVVPRSMAWGFPKWDGHGVVFNARAETALEKRMFRQALLENPVIVPTTGYYEWRLHPGSKKKEKFLFSDGGQELLFLAGFYNVFQEKGGPVPEHFTILTTEANRSMAEYHNRMPILVRQEELEAWLDGSARKRFLGRVPFAVYASLVPERLMEI